VSLSKCFVQIAGLVAVAGVFRCGSKSEMKTAIVTGKVTLGGRPLPGGMITFVSVSAPGKSGVGTIRADGTYEVANAPLGECKVAVSNSSLAQLSTMPAPPAGAPEPPGVSGQRYVKIDPKYAKPERSGLSTSVASDSHTYDIELK